jgi:hypothetical protein
MAKFERSLIEVSKKLEIDLDTVVRKVSFDIFRGVTERTPVDTGWARASWNISFSNADLSIPAKTKSESAAIGINDQQSAKLNLTLPNFPIVWITNSLPYIAPLEAGHSKQSGKGFMIQRTIVDVRRSVEEALNEIR